MKPIEFCDIYEACKSGRDFAIQYETMFDVWNNCQRPDWLFWILRYYKPLKKEQSVKLAISWLNNPTEENRAAAADTAASAAYAAAYAAAHAADAAAAYAAAAAARAAAARAADAAAADAADAAAADAAYTAAYAAAGAAQCDIIKSIIPNPFQ